MVMKYYVYPYKNGSRSARALAEALGGKVLRREGSKFIPRPYKTVLNWGSSTCPYVSGNTPQAVGVIGNKLSAFRKLQDSISGSGVCRVPKWTESRQEALEWLQEGFKVVSRTVLTGHSGQGIIITEPVKGSTPSIDTIPLAPLYVQYIPKDSEYRVHIFNGEVIDVQRKVRDPDREPTDWTVRSHGNGFIYTRNNTDGVSYKESAPGDVVEQAKRAMASSGLLHGGVDVLWNTRKSQAFVLEINSACGLEGATPGIYAQEIRKYYETQRI